MTTSILYLNMVFPDHASRYNEAYQRGWADAAAAIRAEPMPEPSPTRRGDRRTPSPETCSAGYPLNGEEPCSVCGLGPDDLCAETYNTHEQSLDYEGGAHDDDAGR